MMFDFIDGSSGDEQVLCVEDADTGEYGIIRHNVDEECAEIQTCIKEGEGEDPINDSWYIRRRVPSYKIVRRSRRERKGDGKLKEI